VKADAKARIFLGRNDQPAFLLALTANALGKGLGVAGVNLNRQFVVGKNVFHQQFRNFRRRLEPDLANAQAFGRDKGLRQNIATPRLFHLPDRQQNLAQTRLHIRTVIDWPHRKACQPSVRQERW
jgi:hypothetical protein